jgi:deoxyribonuclease-4
VPALPEALPLLGAHLDDPDPLTAARARGADLVQLFLGDPQGWKGPGERPEAAALPVAGVGLVVHAPYVINVATSNNHIRVPSRKLLDSHAKAAAAAGAQALVVHGGHVLAGDDPAVGYANWRKTLERMEHPLPILIENTAGGDRAMARRLDSLARLWDAFDGLPAGQQPGFCLDTCHAHAGGEALEGLVERVLAITGRIDLVHCNGSRDGFDSGRDRHSNLAAGEIEPALVVGVVAGAGAPVIVETPGGESGQAADLALLRDALS